MVNWLYQKGIFDRDEEFIAEVKRQGHRIEFVDYLTFNYKAIVDTVCPYEPSIFRGSLSLGRDIRRTTPYIPGVYMDESALNCLTYYSYFGQYMLNQKYMVMSIAELMRQKNQVFNYLERGESLFVRPVSNMKTFHAGVFPVQGWDLDIICSKLNAEPTTVVLVAGPQKIYKEWRFFMYKDHIITGSRYMKNGELSFQRVSSGLVWDYVEEVMEQIDWYPEKLWSLDICSIGKVYEYRVLEIGSFSCAGEYDIDLAAYVEAGSKSSIEDWEEANS